MLKVYGSYISGNSVKYRVYDRPLIAKRQPTLALVIRRTTVVKLSTYRNGGIFVIKGVPGVLEPFGK